MVITWWGFLLVLNPGFSVSAKSDCFFVGGGCLFFYFAIRQISPGFIKEGNVCGT